MPQSSHGRANLVKEEEPEKGSNPVAGGAQPEVEGCPFSGYLIGLPDLFQGSV